MDYVDSIKCLAADHADRAKQFTSSSEIFNSVAESCISLYDATGGIVDALAAASSSSSAKDVVETEQSSHMAVPSSSTTPSSTSSQGLKDEHGVIGLQLLMISSAYALAGHYNEKLMDLIADQVCGLAC
jgi:hypothetical protein